MQGELLPLEVAHLVVLFAQLFATYPGMSAY